MKIFLPFTIHLDPYLRKVIKEERPHYVAMQSGGLTLDSVSSNVKSRQASKDQRPANGNIVSWNGQPWTAVAVAGLPTPDHSNKAAMYPANYPPMIPTVTHCDYSSVLPTAAGQQLWLKNSLPPRLNDKLLSTLTADDVGELLRHIEGMRSAQVSILLKPLEQIVVH